MSDPRLLSEERLRAIRMDTAEYVARGGGDYAVEEVIELLDHIDALTEELKTGNHLYAKATDRINDLDAHIVALTERVNNAIGHLTDLGMGGWDRVAYALAALGAASLTIQAALETLDES